MSIEKTTAAAVQQPLLDLDGAPRLRRPRASKPTPRRFCLGFCALAGLGVLGFLGVTVFIAVKSIWSTLGQTHVESHWNATAAGAVAGDEHIVRPYFGLKEDGAAVERFDLAATIYVRFKKEAADLEAAGYESDETKWLARWKDIPGHVLESERRRGRIIPIFREIVLRDVPVYSKPIKTTARVVIPKELLPAMIDSNITSPRLIAFFHMLPSSSSSSVIGDRPVKWHSSVKSPFGVPVWTAGLPSEGSYAPLDDDATVDPLSNFLTRSAAVQALFISREAPRDAPRRAADSEEAVSASASPSTAAASSVTPHTGYDIVTRSAVTMVWDASMYNATKFKARLDDLKKVSDKCLGIRADNKFCMNSWENKGHFQNLLELEDDASAGNRTRWRYGPFLSTWLNRPGPKDYLQLPRLPKNETDAPLEDLAFDWHINWNTATPFKLALGAATFTWTQGQEVSKNLTEYRAAASHDHAELLNALFGIHFNPGTHPLTRSVVSYLGAALMFPAWLAAMHYAMTRMISTGISPVGIFLNYTLGIAVDWFLVNDLVACLINWAIISVEFWPFIVLFARLEFDWYGWIPVGITRRRSTHSERASARADATFSTRAKLLFFVVATIAIRFLPVKTHIITTNAPEVDDDFGKISTDSYITQDLLNLLNAAEDGAWLTAALIQIHLNHRLRTFAGQHSFAAVLAFASRALLALPTLFHGWFGRAQLMEPFTFWDAISLVILGTLAWQAVSLPQVAQVEPEEE